MHQTSSGAQLSFDVTGAAAGVDCRDESVLMAADGRMIDDEAIRQAVARAERRLAEQSLRQARRLAQVALWRSGR